MESRGEDIVKRCQVYFLRSLTNKRDTFSLAVVLELAFGHSDKDFVRIEFLCDVGLFTGAANRVRQLVELRMVG